MGIKSFFCSLLSCFNVCRNKEISAEDSCVYSEAGCSLGSRNPSITSSSTCESEVDEGIDVQIFMSNSEYAEFLKQPNRPPTYFEMSLAIVYFYITIGYIFHSLSNGKEKSVVDSPSTTKEHE
jgi:hypothetical protein